MKLGTTIQLRDNEKDTSSSVGNVEVQEGDTIEVVVNTKTNGFGFTLQASLKVKHAPTPGKEGT